MIAPPEGTVERWAWDYVTATDLATKFAPPPLPRNFEKGPTARRIPCPGRPEGLAALRGKIKTPGPEALRSPEKRARLFHTFLHHELQAAELFCWAILAFPDTPRAFKGGLAAIALDEIRHMGLYEDHLRGLGHAFGDFPVRDWFWERIPGATSPAHFVAAMGMGFEGANLDHTLRFSDRLRAIGDEAGAAVEDRISREEIPHVRFALHWFHAFTGRDDFEAWAASLPPPLSPMLMRGAPIDRDGRRRAGFSEAFIEDLGAWKDPAPGS